MPIERKVPGPCSPACTSVIKFMTDQELAPSTGLSVAPYQNVDGYRTINVFVQFTQAAGEEAPVDLGVTFGFDAGGTMGARCYVNLEANLASPQITDFIDVSGQGTWHGDQWKISSYVARFPVMGPFVQVFVYNKAPIKRTVNVWGYLVS